MSPAQHTVVASSSCIGGGCPGTGGGGHTGDIVIGIILLLVGIAGLVGSQVRNRRERVGLTEQRAASVLVTLGRAIGTVLVVIGLILLIAEP